MTPAEAYTVVIYTLGGQAALLGFAGYLAKRFIDTRYKQQEEKFVHELTKERDAINNELSKSLASFTHRNSIFVERQAEALADVYARLWDIKNLLKLFNKSPNESALLDGVSRFQQEYEAFETFYSQKSIYLTPEVESAVNAVCQTIRKKANSLLVHETSTNPQHKVEMSRAIYDASGAIIRSLEMLKLEVRRLLSVDVKTEHQKEEFDELDETPF